MTGSEATLGGRHVGEMGRGGIRGDCLALSTIGTGRMRTWMPGGRRQALGWGFRCGGLGQPSSGAAAVFAAVFAAAYTWSRIAGAVEIAGAEIML